MIRVFIPPGRMPSRIAEAVGATISPPEVVRCVLDSLARAFGRTVRDAADLAGVEVDVIHLVGGGCEIGLLCRLTADSAGIPVIAGPVEATAIGNVVVQARALWSPARLAPGHPGQDRHVERPSAIRPGRSPVRGSASTSWSGGWESASDGTQGPDSSRSSLASTSCAAR